jgi:hypothetical protein
MSSITNRATEWAWSAMITALGILIIPVAVGIIFFATFRAIGGLWRASA